MQNFPKFGVWPVSENVYADADFKAQNLHATIWPCRFNRNEQLLLRVGRNFLDRAAVIITLFFIITVPGRPQASEEVQKTQASTTQNFSQRIGDWSYDERNGISNLYKHTENPEKTHFQGLMLDDDGTFPGDPWGTRSLVFGGRTPGFYFYRVGNPKRRVSKLSITSVDEAFFLIDKYNKRQINRKHLTPLRRELNFFVLSSANDDDRQKLFNYIEKLSRRRFPLTTGDYIYSKNGCSVYRSASDYEIDYSIVQIKNRTYDRERISCLVSALLAHYGVSNVARTFGSPFLVSEDVMKTKIFSSEGSHILSYLYFPFQDSNHGIPLGVNRKLFNSRVKIIAKHVFNLQLSK